MACWNKQLWIVTSMDKSRVLVYEGKRYYMQEDLPWAHPARFVTVSAARKHADEHDGLVNSYKGFSERRRR